MADAWRTGRNRATSLVTGSSPVPPHRRGRARSQRQVAMTAGVVARAVRPRSGFSARPTSCQNASKRRLSTCECQKPKKQASNPRRLSTPASLLCHRHLYPSASESGHADRARRLRDAETALHNGDPGLRLAIWSTRELVSVLGAALPQDWKVHRRSAGPPKEGPATRERCGVRRGP